MNMPNHGASEAAVPVADYSGRIVKEFVMALYNPHTYSPWHNTDFIFGFLWGIPVPFFTLMVHFQAAGQEPSLAACCQVIATNPMHVFFLLHPFIFAVIFGALGTLRAHREAHIKKLLQDVELHCEELCRTNARLQELDKLKTEFLANVTHELKSPLVTALGYTDRILGHHLGEITERQQKGLEVSKRNLIRLRDLIDEILDFSRLEAGTSTMAMVPVDLKDAITMAVEDVALKAHAKQIGICVEVPQEAAPLLGDQRKLCQTVLNLIENAIKYSAHGKDIRVTLQREAKNWHLSVIDQGCGIAADMLPKLFQRFSQVDGSLSRPHDGVGLGLVIVKKIVDAHGGRIWLESEVGRGTVAHVELPILKQPSDAHQRNYLAETPMNHRDKATRGSNDEFPITQ